MSLTIAALCGSLRTGSFNRALLDAAVDLAPSGVTIQIAEIGDLPLYNEDLDPLAKHSGAEDFPAPVERLRQRLKGADALLIATPEYNYSVPGVLQNALDWASRPAFESPLAALPCGIMGASPSPVGTARGQEVLKRVLGSILAQVYPHRGVLVGGAPGKIKDGVLTDEKTREFIAAYLGDFATFARQFQTA